jgi:hypothetical protein
MMKQKMKKMKDTFKHELHLAKAAAKTVNVKPTPKAKTMRVKMTDEEKAQRRRERAVVKELEKAKALPEPMLPAPVTAGPVAAPSIVPAKGGLYRRRW